MVSIASISSEDNQSSFDMYMTQFVQLAALIAVIGDTVVYGTELFCALVMSPALARLDDRALGPVTVFVHRYGDRRMPVPGAICVIAAPASPALAALSAH